jgi:hypothetical protein
MNLLNALILFIVGSIVLVIFISVAIFIVAGAVKLYRNRASLKGIDISDGIDESEIKLIRDALIKKSQADADAAAKAKLLATSEKLAEVAKAS